MHFVRLVYQLKMVSLVTLLHRPLGQSKKGWEWVNSNANKQRRGLWQKEQRYSIITLLKVKFKNLRNWMLGDSCLWKALFCSWHWLLFINEHTPKKNNTPTTKALPWKQSTKKMWRVTDLKSVFYWSRWACSSAAEQAAETHGYIFNSVFQDDCGPFPIK